MPDTDQNQNQDQDEQYPLTGDDLGELHGLASQMDSAGDPRAGKLWDFIGAQSSGGDASKTMEYSFDQSPAQTTSWLDDLEQDLSGESRDAHPPMESSQNDTEDADENAAGYPDGTSDASEETGLNNDIGAAGESSEQNELQLKQPKLGAGPVKSDPDAWNAFMEGLDSHKVGDYTVGELANVLTNESRDLSFIGPTMSLFDNDLDNAKYVQAHAIINNAMRKKPNPMASRTISKAADASYWRQRDIAIMRQAYFDRMTRGADPAEGRTYFGNSPELILKSRPIGDSRQSPFKTFGPFVLGRQKPRYIYIYNDPDKKPQKK